MVGSNKSQSSFLPLKRSVNISPPKYPYQFGTFHFISFPFPSFLSFLFFTSPLASRMSRGALGRGSYQSVLAGTHTLPVAPQFYPAATERLALMRYESQARYNFLVRDAMFDNKMPDAAMVNGHFRLVPGARMQWHYNRVMASLRRREITRRRIAQQEEINDRVLREEQTKNTAKSRGPGPTPIERLRTPDAEAYFDPTKFAGNHWPNFWQHPSQGHLIPKPQWRRFPELGNITRVIERHKPLTSHY